MYSWTKKESGLTAAVIKKKKALSVLDHNPSERKDSPEQALVSGVHHYQSALTSGVLSSGAQCWNHSFTLNPLSLSPVHRHTHRHPQHMWGVPQIHPLQGAEKLCSWLMSICRCLHSETVIQEWAWWTVQEEEVEEEVLKPIRCSQDS